MRAGLVGLVLLLWAGTAAAAEDPVYALYASGDYDGAVRAGEATHTAAGYAMAARALLGQEMLRDSPCLDCLKRAEQFARRAVAADPRFAWGQLWLAVSLGYEARITGIVRARLDDVPAQAHRALEAAIAADPDNPYAVSAMGGWNIAIVGGGAPWRRGCSTARPPGRRSRCSTGPCRSRRTMSRCAIRSACRWPGSTRKNIMTGSRRNSGLQSRPNPPPSMKRRFRPAPRGLQLC